MIYGWMGIFEFESVVIGIVRMGIRYYVILTVGQLLINLSIDWLAYVLVSASAYSAYITVPTPATTPKLRNLFHSFYL